MVFTILFCLDFTTHNHLGGKVKEGGLRPLSLVSNLFVPFSLSYATIGNVPKSVLSQSHVQAGHVPIS